MQSHTKHAKLQDQLVYSLMYCKGRSIHSPCIPHSFQIGGGRSPRIHTKPGEFIHVPLSCQVRTCMQLQHKWSSAEWAYTSTSLQITHLQAFGTGWGDGGGGGGAFTPGWAYTPNFTVQVQFQNMTSNLFRFQASWSSGTTPQRKVNIHELRTPASRKNAGQPQSNSVVVHMTASAEENGLLQSLLR